MKRILLIAALGGAALTAWPNVLLVQQFPTPIQDNWVIPTKVEEIGVMPVFPPDEALISWDTPAQPGQISCPSEYAPAGPPSFVVSMVNLTGKNWPDVWYVADVGTFVSNFDELVGCASGFVWLAFKIDSVGVNQPLVGESMIADGIWQAGEKWDFLLQNYLNNWGGPPSAFGSLDIAWCSTGDLDSTGSILVIPEPAWGFVAMALAGLAAVEIRRRRS